MNNRPTLAELPDMSIAEVAKLPVAMIQKLVEDVAVLTARAKSLNDKIETALDMRFAEKARIARSAEGKDTGRIRFDEDDYCIAADAPKAVVWDQKKLAEAATTIRDEWKEDPAHYLTIKFGVSENKYNAWPPALRALFDPARTLKAGKPSYEILVKKQEFA